jgi:hypothetical protein
MSFTYPFGWDQGLFSWVGDVIVRGGVPYVDAWDMKGPLVYYIYALAQSVFGVHLWSIRIIDAALLIAATMAVFRAAEALTDRATARWSGLVFFLWYASGSFWHTAQPDGWTGLLLIVALSPLVSRTAPAGVVTMVAIGFCIGLTALFKPLWAVFLVLPIAHLVVNRSSRMLAMSAAVLVGWAVPIALAAGWFALHGALPELIAVHLKYSAFYAGLSTSDRPRRLVEYFFSSRVIAVALPVILYGAFALWHKRRPAAILLAAWAALVVLGVTLQGRFFAYHWLPMLPAATLLGAVSLHEIRSKMPALAHVTCAVIVLHCLAPIALEEARFLSWAAGRTSTEAYYDAYGEPGDDMRAVRWLRDHGQPGDVYIFGWQGAVSWLSERRIVSRFGFSMPLMIGEGSEIRARYRNELLAALRATPPRYILVGTQSERIIGRVLTAADFPEFADLLQHDYRERVRLGKITIYER